MDTKPKNKRKRKSDLSEHRTPKYRYVEATCSSQESCTSTNVQEVLQLEQNELKKYPQTMNERDSGNEIPNMANQRSPTSPPISSPQRQISSTCSTSLITTSTSSPQTPTVQSSTIMTDTQQAPLQSSLDISLSLSTSQEASQVRPSLQEPTLSLSDSDEEKTLSEQNNAKGIPANSDQRLVESPSYSTPHREISSTSSTSALVTTSPTHPIISTAQSSTSTMHTQQTLSQVLHSVSLEILPSTSPEGLPKRTSLQQTTLPPVHCEKEDTMNERDSANEIPNTADQGPPTSPPNSSPQSQISSTCSTSSLITTSTTSPWTPTVQSSTIMTDTQQASLQSSLDLSLSSSQEAPQVRPSLQEPTLSLADSDDEKTMNERDNGNEIPNAANQGPPTTPPNSSPQSQISSTCYKSSLITTSTTSPRTPTVQSSTIMTDTQQPPLQSSLDISLSLSSSQEAPQVRPSLQEPTLSLSDSDEEKTINKGDSANKIPYMSGQSPLTSPSISLQQSQQSQISWTSSSSLFLTATSKTPPSIQTVQSPMVTKHTQQPPLQSLNYTSVSLPSSLPEISQVGTQLQQSFLPCTISDEESNFLRAANLIFAVVPKAVRITFDFKHPSSGLSAELAAKESELRNCKGISAENCKVLFPSNKGTVDSREFDITLLVALLRNFTKIPPPKKGWQDTPDKSDTSEGADLVRIRLWRNTLAHTKDAKLTTNEFNDLWKDMKSAISRLSGGLLDSDVDQLETSPMDKSYIIVIRELIHQNQHILNHEKILEKHSNEITMMQRRSIPRHVREIHHQLIEDWVQDDKLYFETQASKNAWASLASMNRLLLYGSPGSGKTATARHLALRLCYEKDYDIVPCPNIEKMLDYSDVHEKRVFVIDDILGVHSLERSKYTKIQDNKDFTQKILQRNTKLLMTCRRSVYKESKEYESFITQDALDVESSFNVSEKKKIFEYHCKGAGLTTSEYEQFDFTSVHNMFPFLCKIFFEIESYRKMGFKFFISPVKCLIDEMSKLYLHNKIHYACLVLCVLKERSRQNLRENTHSELKDDICERCRTTGLTDWVIKDTLEYMTGTYTIKKETGYSIMHDAFYETVAYSYGQKFPDQIIKYMSGSYLRANVFVGQREIDDCSIILKDEHYSLLSERLGEDIEAMDLHNVFKNPCFQSPKFTDTFINTIQDKLRYVDMKNLFLRKHDYCDILTPDTSPCGKQDAEYYRQLLLVGYQRKKEDKAFNIRVISWIVYYNHLKILEYLVMRVIENGDSYDEVFGSDIEEQTRLLILSCFSGNLDLVKLILNYINCECITTVLKDVEPPMTETAFTTACWCGHLPIVQEFIQRNADVNRTNGLGKTGLHKASETGQLKIVETLLSQKASCNQFDNTTETPLFSASEYGHLPVVKLLIENGAICNKFDDSKRSPLYVACQFGHLSVVNYLLQKNANINFSGFLGRSPLHVASVEGHLNIVTALIVSGAVCNRRDYDGSSPLLLASRSGHEDIVQKLLEHGADSKISDCKGKTPLWEAVEAGHKPVLQTMMLHHADFNENDNEGKCPMYYAAENAKIEELKLLVKAKNINFRCSSKSFITPLHRALIGMNRDIFCELLQSENKREKFSGNQHLFNILENLRHAKLCLDGGDRVVVFNTKNYCLNADLWEIICNRNETFFKKMLTLDLETKFCYIETYFAKDLLVDSVLDSQYPVEFRKEKVKLLLDFKSIDLKERDEKCISVLEKVRKEYVKLKHERDSRAREYSEVLKTFRCRVRRYSF